MTTKMSFQEKLLLMMMVVVVVDNDDDDDVHIYRRQRGRVVGALVPL